MENLDFISSGIKPPQVEDIGTAMRRAKAEQLTLGNLALAQQNAKQQLAEGALTLEHAQRASDDARAINDAFATSTMPGPDGKPKIDRDGVITKLQSSGRGIAAAQVQAQFAAQDKAQAEGIEAQNKAQVSTLNLVSARAGEMAKLAQGVKDAAPENKQAAYADMHSKAVHLGLITPQQQSEFPAQYDPSLDPHLDALILGAQDAKTRSELQTANLTRNKDQAQIDKDNQATAENWRIATANQLSLAANPQQYAGILATQAQRGAPPSVLAQFPKAEEWTPETPRQLQLSAMTAEQRTQADLRDKEIKKLNTPAELAAVASDPTRTPQERQTAKDALAILERHAIASRPPAPVINLSPDALNMYADALRAGSPLPNLGRNSTDTINKISNLAASKGPIDLASAKATYTADKSSLVSYTKQLDNLKGFETGAIKNLKMFLDAAEKIPDTGVPWLNTPVRLLTDKLVGSENMAAVNATRSIGLREIARITNDPKMSGQLTDHARAEVMAFSPENATLGQIRQVARDVLQDVANVRSGVEAQKGAIENRLRTVDNAAGASAAPPLPAKLSAADVGHTYTNKAGKPIKITAVNPDNDTLFKFAEVKQ